MSWLAPDGDGVRLTIRVQPRAARTEVAGPYGDDALRIRLRAPPVDGAANRALIAFLAEALGVPGSAVSIQRGETGRLKTVRVRGTTVGRARRALASDRAP